MRDERFFAGLAAADAHLASGAPLRGGELLQGERGGRPGPGQAEPVYELEQAGADYPADVLLRSDASTDTRTSSERMMLGSPTS